jgi:hypothetical protein
MTVWGTLAAWWPKIVDFLNLEFMKAVLGSIFGAWGGALYGAKAAQRIADKKAEREQMLTEMRSINGALELLFAMVNTCFNLKRQHVLELKQQYDQLRTGVHDHYTRVNAGEKLPPLEMGYIDLRTLDVLRFRTERVEEILIEKVSSTGRVVPLFGVFVQSVEALNQLIRQRNELIQGHLQNQINQTQNMQMLFGIPMSGGRIDDRYRNYIDGISQTTDDCIFFAVAITKQLKLHGDRVRNRYVQRFGDAPRIGELELDLATKTEMMPPEENYASWQKAFILSVPRTAGKRFAKWWYAARKLWRKLQRP